MGAEESAVPIERAAVGINRDAVQVPTIAALIKGGSEEVPPEGTGLERLEGTSRCPTGHCEPILEHHIGWHSADNAGKELLGGNGAGSHSQLLDVNTRVPPFEFAIDRLLTLHIRVGRHAPDDQISRQGHSSAQ